jgi:hypothetical protein
VSVRVLPTDRIRAEIEAVFAADRIWFMCWRIGPAQVRRLLT